MNAEDFAEWLVALWRSASPQEQKAMHFVVKAILGADPIARDRLLALHDHVADPDYVRSALFGLAEDYADLPWPERPRLPA